MNIWENKHNMDMTRHWTHRLKLVFGECQDVALVIIYESKKLDHSSVYLRNSEAITKGFKFFFFQKGTWKE